MTITGHENVESVDIRRNMQFTTIVVSLNAFNLISGTLDSILEQDCDDYEVVLVDGASTDGTLEIIRQYETKFQGKLRWISEPDRGIYDAMNKGIAMSKGNFVNFLNCGDTYEPQAFAHIREAIRLKPETQVAYGISRYFDDTGEVRLIRECHTRFRERNICHQSIWYHRDLFEKFGVYDLQYRFLADYDFNIRLYQNGAVFNPVDAIVVNYSLTGISSCNTNEEEGQKEAMSIFYSHNLVDKAHYDWFMGSFGRRRFLNKLRDLARKFYLFSK